MVDEVNLPAQQPKTSWTIPLLLILSIFSLAISGYLFWQNQQLVKQLTVVQMPTTSPTTFAASPSPAAELPDPTAKWEIYSNPKYKLNFQYPANLSMVENIVSINHMQLIFDKEKSNGFLINLSVNYPPSQPKYLIDTEAHDTKIIKGLSWSVFDLSLETGLQIEKNQALYSVIFPPSREKEVDQILATFKFTE